jgi:hypothetical protein
MNANDTFWGKWDDNTPDRETAKPDQMGFDEYYDEVIRLLREMNETLNPVPDRDTVRDDYDNDCTPTESAHAFSLDWSLNP